MKIVVALCALSVAIRPAYAQGVQRDRWVEVGGNDKITAYVDRQSLRREGARVKVWSKWVYTVAKETFDTPKKTYLSTKDFSIYRCDGRTYATLQSIKYASADGSGEVVDTSSYPESKALFDEIAPETIGESILEYVCRATSARRR